MPAISRPESPAGAGRARSQSAALLSPLLETSKRRARAFPGERELRSIPLEDELFMSPWHKWAVYRRPPLKMLAHVLLIAVATPTIMYAEYQKVSFLHDLRVELVKLYYPARCRPECLQGGGTGSRYCELPPQCAFATVDDVQSFVGGVVDGYAAAQAQLVSRILYAPSKARPGEPEAVHMRIYWMRARSLDEELAGSSRYELQQGGPAARLGPLCGVPALNMSEREVFDRLSSLELRIHFVSVEYEELYGGKRRLLNVLYPSGPIVWSFALRLQPTPGRQLLQLRAQLHVEADRDPSIPLAQLVCTAAFCSWLSICALSLLCIGLSVRSLGLTLVRLRWLDQAAAAEAEPQGGESGEGARGSPPPSPSASCRSERSLGARPPLLDSAGRSRTDDSCEAARALLAKVAGRGGFTQLHRLHSCSRLPSAELPSSDLERAAPDEQDDGGGWHGAGRPAAADGPLARSPALPEPPAQQRGAREAAPPPMPTAASASPRQPRQPPLAVRSASAAALARQPAPAPVAPPLTPVRSASRGSPPTQRAFASGCGPHAAERNGGGAARAPSGGVNAGYSASAGDASAAAWRRLGLCGRLFTLLSAHALVLLLGAGCLFHAALLHLRVQLRLDPSIDLIEQGWPSLATALGIACVWLSLTRYFEWLPALYTFTHTLRRAARSSLTLMAAVLPVFLAYALAGTVLFSDSTGNFSGFSTACVTLWAMCVGDEVNEDFRQVYAARPLVGRLFTYSFTAIFYFICANIFVFLIEAAHYAALRDILAASGSPWAQRLLRRSGLGEPGGGAPLGLTAPHGELEHHRLHEQAARAASGGLDGYRAPAQHAESPSEAIERIELLVLEQQRLLLELLQAQRQQQQQLAHRGAAAAR